MKQIIKELLRFGILAIMAAYLCFISFQYGEASATVEVCLGKGLVPTVNKTTGNYTCAEPKITPYKLERREMKLNESQWGAIQNISFS